MSSANKNDGLLLFIYLMLLQFETAGFNPC